MEKVRMAIVGLGHIGRRYAFWLRKLPQAQLVAVCDTDPLLKIGVESEFQVPFFTQLDLMLEKGPAADLYIVATPNGLHYEIAFQILKADKGVIVEKPLALQSQQAQALLTYAESRKLPIFCVLQNRTVPILRWIQKSLGTPQLIYALLLWNRDSHYYFPGSWHGSRLLDGGALFTQFSHFIDTIQWLAGRLEWHAASIFNIAHPQIEIEDMGHLIFQTEKKTQGILAYTTTCWAKNFDTRLTLLYKDASITLTGPFSDTVEKYEGRIPLPDFSSQTQKDTATPHLLFLEEIVTDYRQGSWTYESAYAAMQNVQAIEKAYRKAGWE